MSGIAPSTLAVLLPISPGAGEQVLAALEALGAPDRGPFANVPGTHFARFAYVPSLTGPNGIALQEEGSFLLMTADFDSTPRDWTSLLCDSAGAQLDGVLKHCVGFPGSADPAAVAEYFSSHHAPPGFTVPGYRRATVEEVRAALRLKRNLTALAVRAQAEGLTGRALREAWEAARR